MNRILPLGRRIAATFLISSAIPAGAAVVDAIFTAAGDVPVSVPSYSAAGHTLNLSLNFAPPAGTALTVVRNSGLPFINGRFGNLAHGQRIDLPFNGIRYPYVANYFGGDGNDLVLEWANTRLAVWGDNTNGQLGLGHTSTARIPTALPLTGALAGKTILKFAMGTNHTVALCSDGSLAAWGANGVGQLGNNSTVSNQVPVPVDRTGVLAGKTVSSIVAGGAFTLALCSDGTLAFWGSGTAGVAGNGSQSGNVLVPTAVDQNGVLAGKTVVAITASEYSCWALCSDGTLAGWGSNGGGQLGDGTTSNQSVPAKVLMNGALAGKSVIAISSGVSPMMALCSDGTLAAWGSNQYGQLGNNSTETFSTVPVAVVNTGVLAGKTVTSFSAGSGDCLALCSDSTLASWGRNDSGQLGINSTTLSRVPVAVVRSGVLSGKTIIQTASGEAHHLALCSDGTLAAWGSNSSSSLGDDSTSSYKTAPTLVNSTVLQPGERFCKAVTSRVAEFSISMIAMPPAPVVVTENAGPVGDQSAILRGTASANGTATTLSFEYGPTPALGRTLAAVPAMLGGTADTAVSAELSGLAPGSPWYYRLTGSNVAGVSVGDTRAFTSAAATALSSLTTPAGLLSPAFQTSVANYWVTVSSDTTGISFTPTAAQAGATVTVGGNVVSSGAASPSLSLVTGNNLIPVTVTSADGTATFSYMVQVSRLPGTFVFATASDIPFTATGFDLTGKQADLSLRHAPKPGVVLTLLNNTSQDFIRGSFSNLPQGGIVTLTHDGIGYAYVADYFGGTGNDLVLRWANCRAVAWGSNSNGELGFATPTQTSSPLPVTTTGELAGKTLMATAAGNNFSIALDQNGELYGWGVNQYGQLGIGTTTLSKVPRKVLNDGVLAGRRVIAVSAGFNHVLALCSDGTLASWGQNNQGQLGNGSTTESLQPVAVDQTGVLEGKTVVQIVARGDFSFVLCSDGSLATWGDNNYAQLGGGTLYRQLLPMAVPREGPLKDRSVTQITAGGTFCLVLLDDGSLAGWGRNDAGYLGDGTLIERKTAVAAGKGGALAGKTIVSLRAGLHHSLALCSDGSIAAWGVNNYGQLGNGATGSAVSVPVSVNRSGVLSGKTVTAVAGGGLISFASCSDGTIASWGLNDSGQLGNGTTTTSLVPVLVNPATAYPGSGFSAISPGNFASHAVTLLAFPPPPTAETLAASAIGDLGATLNGEVRANGSSTSVSFEYGLTTAYGTVVPANPTSASGTSTTPVQATLGNLLGGTTYHYRIIASGPGAELRGADATFTTTTEAALTDLRAGGHAVLPAFSQEISSYSVTVPQAVNSIVIDPRPLAANATVTVNGAALTAGGNSIPLVDGPNPVTIVVTSADGTNTRSYTVAVTRLPEILVISSATATPLSLGRLDVAGQSLAVGLQFAPNPGTNLRLLDVTGFEPISGRFDNLAHGQQLTLSFGGVDYPFVANYFGGDGNDLVLHWANSRLFGWGINRNGALGMPSSNSVLVPTPASTSPLLAGKTILSLAAGTNHSLTLLSDGTLVGVGENSNGQLGTAAVASQTSVLVEVDRSGVLAGKNITAIAAGNNHSLALCSDGTVASWGGNDYGQLGNGKTTMSKVPVEVDRGGVLAGKRVISISAGIHYSLVLCSDGTIAAWGKNDYGQLGNGLLTNSNLPVSVDRNGALAGKTVTQLRCGNESSVALCSDGTLAAWGRGNVGQLGNGSSTDRMVPTLVTSSGVLAGKKPVSIASGSGFSVTLCQDGTLVSWGSASLGSLGNGSTTQTLVPVLVSMTGVLAGKTVTAIATGGYHALAVASDGSAASWGYGGNGQIGNGTTTGGLTPVAVSTSLLRPGERFALPYCGCGTDFSLALVASPPSPTARTLAASLVRDTAATLNASVGPNGGSTSVRFEYGLTTSYGTIIAATPASVSGSGQTTVSAALGSLLQGTTYHFRVVAEGSGGTSYGEDRNFTTTTLGTLAGLNLSQGILNPAFELTRTAYYTVVSADIPAIAVTPLASHPTATVTVNDVPLVSGTTSAPIPLVAGNNLVAVKVTSQDGLNVTTYQVAVTRLPQSLAFPAADSVPVTVPGFFAAGDASPFALGHAPQVGASLRVIDNTGTEAIRGRFDNLEQGQRVFLEFAGITYPFVANYTGGTGNDLVLEWGNVRIASFGSNSSGQSGSGSTATSLTVLTPVESSGAFAGKTLRALYPGFDHVVARNLDESLVSWGENQSGELGDGSNTDRPIPVTIPFTGALAGKTVVTVAAGYYHCLALCSDGTVAGWGSNGLGQLGNGSNQDSSTPVAVTANGVLSGKTVVAIAAGARHSLALCQDGTIAAWGNNMTSELGGGSSLSFSMAPVLVPANGGLAGRRPLSIVAGNGFSLALCDDGNIAGWGDNSEGPLGDNSTGLRITPVLVNRSGVLAGKSVLRLAAGSTHVIAQLSDGSLAAWGDNLNGALGDGTTTDRSVPVLVNRTGVLAGKQIVDFDAGGGHSIAVCADGSLAAWGSNNLGQLGDGTTTNRSLPVLVSTTTLKPGERFVSGTRLANLGGSFAVIASPPAPVATTLDVAEIRDDAALLNAEVAPNGQPSSVWFEFGPTEFLGTVLAPTPATVDGTGNKSVTGSVAGLIPGTTYHYRVVASGPGGVVRGERKTFTTTTKATLAALVSKEGIIGPDFDPRTTDYWMTVPSSVTSVTFTPTVALPGGTVTVAGAATTSGQASSPVSVSTGQTPVAIAVTSADGTATLTYRVTVTRLPQAVTFAAANYVPLQVSDLRPTGSLEINLAFAPPVGTNLTLVDNRGRGFIRGTFDNLPRGGLLRLDHNGISYEFVANYYGGDGNDLVLQWANVRPMSWGRNDSGQVGNRGQTSTTPVSIIDDKGVLAGKTVTSVAVGSTHTLVLCADGTMAGWGSNTYGQLGSGNPASTNVPVRVPLEGDLAGKTVIAIAAAAGHNLALCSDGTVAGWGSNFNGQLGAWPGKATSTPVALEKTGALAGKRVFKIATTDSCSFALCEDGTLVAWGANASGQLGDGTTESRLIPVQVGNGSLTGRKVVTIAVGSQHVVALCEDGALLAWGYNGEGQIGDNTSVNRSSPVLVSANGVLAGKRVMSIACGSTHTLALCADGTLAAWGNNGAGRLGNGNSTSSPVPVAVNLSGVLAGKVIQRISGGNAASYALCSDGSVATWGDGDYGAQGISGSADSNVPVMAGAGELLAGEKFTQLAASPIGAHTFALAAGPIRATVTTLAAQVEGDTMATLNGVVLANTSNASVWFEYGTTTAYGQKIAATPASAVAGATTPVSAMLTGLQGGATYHYRAVASGAGGVSYGESSTFTTGDEAALASLGLGGVQLSPAFTPGGGSYLASVSTAVSSLEVSAVARIPTATVQIGETTPTEGGATANVAVTAGSNTIAVTVKGTGSATRRYEITVIRFPKSITYLTGKEKPLALERVFVGGAAPTFALGFAPLPGTSLTVAEQSGLAPLQGRFDDLAEGQAVTLVHDGVSYRFIANYHGGDGNDLVLEWANRRLVGWGRNANGELGHPVLQDMTAPVAVTADAFPANGTLFAVDGAGTSNHTLALGSDGVVYAWGANNNGQLGNGSVFNGTISVPAAVDRSGILAGKRVVKIAAGGDHSLALCEDGSLVAWGNNGSGQLGDGTQTNRSVPVAVDVSGVLAGKTIIAIGASHYSSFAACSDGTVASWGGNGSGILGYGVSSGSFSRPIEVSRTGALLGKVVVALAPGENHCLALCSDGTFVAWGDNTYGQVGANGTATVPVLVDTTGALAGKRVVRIAAARAHSIAVCSDGTIVAWGRNNYGEVGNGNGAVTRLPADITTNGGLNGKNVVSVEASIFNSLAICADGSAVDWGYNAWGQLGNGGKVDSALPVIVQPGVILPGERIIGSTAAVGFHIALVASPPPAVVETLAASLVTDTGATLNGEVGANGTATTVSFEYGLTSAYGSTVDGIPGTVSGTSPLEVTATIGNLLPGTTYHYRVVGRSAGGVLRGDDRSFTTGRQSALAGLGLSQGILFPSFAFNEFRYSATVPFSVSALTLSPVAEVTGATITINGGSESTVPLLAGENIITVQVQGPGAVPLTYILVVTRLPERFALDSPASIGASAADFDVAGITLPVDLNHAPATGATLMLLKNAGSEFIRGRFTNLPHGGVIPLQQGGISYEFVANYYGGDGNDLVLQWARTRLAGWGGNDDAQLGESVPSPSVVPASLLLSGQLGDTPILALAAGYRHSLALAADGEIYAWGYDGWGELGQAGRTTSAIPVKVDRSGVLAGRTVVAIDAGYSQSLALCSDGRIAVWGWNGANQLIMPGIEYSDVPVLVDDSGVLAGKRVVKIAAGFYHNLALCSDGTLVAWGQNASGRLGNNSTKIPTMPVLVDTAGVLNGKRVVDIAAGDQHSLVLCSDGTIAAWGNNQSGQLGIGNTDSPKLLPVAVPVSGALVGKTVVAINANAVHSLALCSDGSVLAWGGNNSGRLGDGFTVQRNSPVLVSTAGVLGGKQVVSVSSGNNHSMALTADGTAVAWGDNGFGQLGINSTTTSNSPVAVNTTGLAAGERFVALRSGNAAVHSLGIIARPPRPAVVTLAATDVAGSSATLRGSISANANDATLAFEYGLTTAYGDRIDASPATANGTATTPVLANLTGLISGATYHYRLVATSAAGITTGEDRSFTTSNMAALASLGLSSGVFDEPFASSRLNYAVTLPFSTGQVAVTAVPGHAGATVTINGGNNANVNVPTGVSTITIEVTAPDGLTRQSYRIQLTRLPEVFRFAAASSVPLRTDAISLTGLSASFALDFPPQPGTRLTAVDNTGSGFIRGTFANLSPGQLVTLEFGGRSYRFAANYHGGDGNDLVLEWAATRLFGWGAGTSPTSKIPVPAITTSQIFSSPIIAIAGGPGHRLGLLADGSIRGWGGNSTGQLGNGAVATSSQTPSLVDTSGVLAGKTVISVATNERHSLALCSDGTVAGWGLANNGVLGLPGSGITVKSPIAIPVATMVPGKAVRGVAAGTRNSYAWFEDGTVVAWGHNQYGQLGNNGSFESPVPVKVVAGGALAGKKVVSIVTGDDCVFALCADGTVASWGLNTYGQLGNNSTTNSRVPVAVNVSGVLAGKSIVSLAAGDAFVVALCADGTVVTWGRNNFGQLGGVFSGSSSPVPVSIDQTGVLAGKTVAMVAAGESHAWVICSDGSMAAWGYNTVGQIGDNTTTNQPKPVLVNRDNLAAGEVFTSITSSGGGHTSYALAALPQLPLIATLQATPVRGTTATMRGEALTDGVQGDLFFDYGVDTAYGNVVSASPSAGSGSGTVAASAVITNLPPGSTWHYRLRFVTSYGSYYGEDRTFTTSTDVTLASLGTSVGALQPYFGPLVTRYALSVPSSTTALTFNPVTAAAGATVTVDGGPASAPIGLSAGANDVVMEVTEPGGGDSLRYLVVVNRLPETVLFASTADTPLSGREFSANGALPPVKLGFVPAPGTVLTLVNNTGGNPIHGRFTNLPHGGAIDLEAAGTAYRFVINYSGGDGNDLVLQWANSRLFGWGESIYGQIGNGYTDIHVNPTLAGVGGAMTGKKVLSAGVGGYFSLVLNTDGSLASWGEQGSTGLLGNGSTAQQVQTPVAVTVTDALAGKKVVSIAPGRNFNIAVCDDGSMAGWGSNDRGQLNIDTATYSSNVPRVIPMTGALAGRRVTAVALGDRFALARCSDGSLVAWGASDSGKLGNSGVALGAAPTLVVSSGPLSGKHVSAISVGAQHCLVLCEDGSVVSWGLNDQGQLGDGTLTTRWAPVAVTGGVLAGKKVVAIRAGENHSLALCADGTLAAWGSNNNGQLGDNSKQSRPLPVAVDRSGILAGKSIVGVSASVANSFAYCSDGTIVSWGANDNGQAGDGSRTARLSPVAVSTVTLRPDEHFMSLPQRHAGRHTLVSVGSPLGSATTLAATQIGGTRARLNGSVDPNRNTLAVSFEYGLDTNYGNEVAATPAVASGISPSSTSVAISGLKPGTIYHFRTVATGDGGIVRGEDQTFTTLSDNALLSSLAVAEGVLGPDFNSKVTTYHVSVPASASAVTVVPVTDHPRASFEIAGASGNTVSLDGLRTIIGITVTAEDGETQKTYSVIVTRLPEVFHLGDDGAAQLTVDGLSARGYPVKFSLDHPPLPGSILKVVDNTGLAFIHGTFSNLSRGQKVTLVYNGLEYDFVANYNGGDGNDLVLHWAATRSYAWGLNSHGQLGDGTTTRRLVPVGIDDSGVLSGKTVLNVSGGYLHSLALCSDGTVAAWGSSAQGQLGHGSTTGSFTPVAVDFSDAGGEVIAVAAGPFHNLALRADGRVVAWGYNNHGQLGTGDKVTYLRPVLIPMTGALSGKQVIAVATGTYQSFALCSDGTVAAWGYNDEGELGDGTTVASSIPVAVDSSGVLAGKQVASIAAGQYHTLARCTDGTLVSWGYNARGQLGCGNQSDSHVPVAVNIAGVLAGKAVVGLSAGESHSAVRCADGIVAAWGFNTRFQLGNGSTLSSSVPAAVDFSALPGRTVASVTAGRSHHYARFTDGTLAAWGENNQGQLGNQTTAAVSRPGALGLSATPAGSRAMQEASGPAAYHGVVVVGIPASRLVTTSNAALAARAIGDDIDSDNDGIADVIELAFGLDLGSDSSGKVPVPMWEGGRYGFRFATPGGVSGFLYGAEWSTTLEPDSWHEIPDTGTGGHHKFMILAPDSPRLFLRIKAEPFSP